MSRLPSPLLVTVLALSVFACANRASQSDGPESGAGAGDDLEESGEPRTSIGQLDAALAEHWRSAKVEPVAVASDAEYLRRLSLDLIGRVPTRAEVEAFLADASRDKRADKVDALLASPEFAEHWAGHWASLLVPGDKRAKRVGQKPVEAFLAEAIEANRPWHEVVDALLTADGSPRDNPAAGYIAAMLSRNADPETSLAQLSSTSSRVFLGARIECAQCHDHPYVMDFSRDDFWAMTAYFGRTAAVVDRKAKPITVDLYERGAGQLRVALGADDDPRKQAVKPRFMGAEAVDADPRGGPADDAEVEASAETMGGDMGMGEAPARPKKGKGKKNKKQAKPAKKQAKKQAKKAKQTPHDPSIGANRRQRLAAAIVDDPRFAEATVGLVWSHLFGRGIVEPWDDLLSESEVPPLLSTLAEDFRAHEHDLRHLVRTIVLSEAYQLSSASEFEQEQAAARERAFAKAAVRPLAAEPLFASVITATGLEQVQGRGFKAAVRQRKQKALSEFEFVFGDDEMASADAFTGSVPQALLLLNGALTNQGVVAREGGALATLLAESEDTDARLRALWLTVYGRPPTDAERAIGRDAVGTGDNTKAWEDLMFAMLYSSEFGSNH